MRRSRGHDRGKPDFDRVMAGLIPWSYEGFQEAYDFFLRLTKTPPDDWDLSDMPSFRLRDDDTGETETFEFNVCHPTNQLARFFFDKYEDVDEASSHFYRFQQIQRFLRQNLQRLVEDGWAELGEVGCLLNTRIFHVLCEIPYSGTAELEDQRHSVFSYDDVIERAADLPGEES